MNRLATWTLRTALVALLALAVDVGCDSSDETSGDVPQQGKVPPAPAGSVTTSTEARTFALDSVWLGETDRAGTKNADAWRQYGYNLDGLVSNVTSASAPDLAKVCKRVESAESSVHQDGEGGIDNSFGANILTLLTPFVATPSISFSEGIRDGAGTALLKIVGLTNDPAQTNTGLSATILVGGDFSADPNVKPTFTTADDWPYLAEPQVPLSGSYVSSGVFVSGQKGANVELSLSVRGQTVRLKITNAVISFRHDPAKKSLEDGTIAGVISTEELVSGISSIAGQFSEDLCGGATLDTIKASIRQASDMISGGAQDPSKTCDGISVGFGFTAKQVGNPTKVAAQEPPPPDPCDPSAAADAGSDASQ